MRKQKRQRTPILSRGGLALRIAAVVLVFAALAISFAYAYYNKLAERHAESLFASTLGRGAAPQYESARQSADLFGALMGGSLAANYALLFCVFEHSRRRLAADNARIAREKLELEASEARYRLIERDSGAIVLEFDYAGRAVEANDLFYQFTGEGPHCEYFLNGTRLHPDDRAIFSKLVAKAHTASCGSAGEVRMRDRNGDYVWFSVNLCGLTAETGEVVRVIGKFTNIDIQKRKMELLELQAQTDPMTGLYNKAVTEEIIARILHDEPDEVHALLIFDIDDLKSINDTCGHAEGDRAIRALTLLLRRHFRSTDIVGRIGGDEFMVLLRNIRSEEHLRTTVATLMQRLAALAILEGMPYTISVSLGAVLTHAGEQEGFSELYRKADAALYSVKRRGKNGFALYGETVA